MGAMCAGLGRKDRAAFSLESGFEQLGEIDSAHAVQRDTSEAPLVNPPSLPHSFGIMIYTF